MDRKHVFILAMLAILPRVVLVVGTLGWNGISLPQYVSMHDGREYIIYSTKINAHNLADLPHETTRLFPGYPAVISVVGQLLGRPLASVAISILGALLAVMLFHALFRDFWLSAYFAVFTPSWLLYSSLAMSEGLFLGCSLLGLYLFQQERDVLGGLVIGFATVVRPVGVFLFLAIAAAILMEREYRALVRFGLAFVVIPLVWGFISKLTWGTFGKSVAALYGYLERDFDIPLRAVIVETLKPQVSLLKKLLVWGHVVLGIGGFVLLVRGWMRERTGLMLVLIVWLGLSLVFYFMISTKFTFDCLDRFLITCLPPIMVGLKRILPRHLAVYALVLLLGLAIGLYWNHNMIQALEMKGMIEVGV